MGRDRTLLQTLLESLVPEGKKVYFQPPAKVEMVYPCIVYKLYDVETKFADNSPYSKTKRYQITVIDPNPDTEIPDKVGDLPLSSFVRFFVADGLNHYIYNVYF
jgi:hypothetical protein